MKTIVSKVLERLVSEITYEDADKVDTISGLVFYSANAKVSSLSQDANNTPNNVADNILKIFFIIILVFWINNQGSELNYD